MLAYSLNDLKSSVLGRLALIFSLFLTFLACSCLLLSESQRIYLAGWGFRAKIRVVADPLMTASIEDQSQQNKFTSLFVDKAHPSMYALNPAEDCAKHIEIVEQNDLARVIKYVLKPGEKTGWHFHDLGFITIQLSEGTLMNYVAKDHSEMATATGRETHFKPGAAVSHKAPLLHNAVNTGDCDVIAYEIEFLRAPATARMSEFDH